MYLIKLFTLVKFNFLKQSKDGLNSELLFSQIGRQTKGKKSLSYYLPQVGVRQTYSCFLIYLERERERERGYWFTSTACQHDLGYFVLWD